MEKRKIGFTIFVSTKFRNVFWLTCGKEQKAPIVVSTGLCSNIFQWEIPLVCDDEERVDMCSIKLDNREVSLGVLQRVSGKA